MLVEVLESREKEETDYGREQVGHLYFLGSALQTPQRGSDIVGCGWRRAYKGDCGFASIGETV